MKVFAVIANKGSLETFKEGEYRRTPCISKYILRVFEKGEDALAYLHDIYYKYGSENSSFRSDENKKNGVTYACFHDHIKEKDDAVTMGGVPLKDCTTHLYISVYPLEVANSESLIDLQSDIEDIIINRGDNLFEI